MHLKLVTDEKFNGAIWRMEIDELSQTLFVEIRNNEEKQVHFGAVDLVTGKTLFKDLTTPERWLTGIETAYNGILVLHYYQSETGPTHKGLMAVDAFGAKMLWSNYNFAFDHLSVNGPIVYDTRLHPRKLFLADIETGETTRIYQPSVYKELKNNIVVPLLKDPGLVAQEFKPVHPFGNMVHYLEYNNFRIVSLHALKGGQLKQWLYIFDCISPDSCRKVYEDLLNSDIQKIQPEAFILHKNRLIYIKNKSELKVLCL
jgi:hypothetical protein